MATPITATKATFVAGGKTVFGNKRIAMSTVTFLTEATPGTVIAAVTTDTMPAAGIALTPAQVGLKHFDMVFVSANAGTVGTGCLNSYEWDSTNSKIQIYDNAGGDAAVTTGETVNVFAIGY